MFRRNLRAIDRTRHDFFVKSKQLLFPVNSIDHPDADQRLPEWSLLVDVARWSESEDATKRELGVEWNRFVGRTVRWKMVAERTVFFDPQAGERASIFSREEFFERSLHEALPPALRELPLRVDLPRHLHRPGTRGPPSGGGKAGRSTP